MNPVRREDLLDHVTYGERRERLRESFMRAKELRRVHVGEHLTFLFENTETVRYQIQEMMRVERIVKEADIEHEIATYNELLGGEGELGCTLLIEIDEPVERARKLARWIELPEHVYVRAADGARIGARFDRRQVGDGRLSSVQYLKFDMRSRAPVAVGCDLEEIATETRLSDEQMKALAEDLS